MRGEEKEERLAAKDAVTQLKRSNKPPALESTASDDPQAHTLGCVRGCDQEPGVIKSSWKQGLEEKEENLAAKDAVIPARTLELNPKTRSSKL